MTGTLLYDANGWPYFGNEAIGQTAGQIRDLPAYTRELATKLQNGDAAVADAENAATAAQASATAAATSAAAYTARHALRAYGSQVQSLPNGAVTAISWPAGGITAPASMWNSATPKRILCPVAGDLTISVTGVWGFVTTGDRLLGIQQGATLHVISAGAIGSAGQYGPTTNGQITIPVTAGSYVEVMAGHFAGAAITPQLRFSARID